MDFLLLGICMFVSFMFGVFLSVIFYSKVCYAGDLIINLSRDDKDIAQFVFEKPLDDISKLNFIVIKVRQSDKIKSLDDAQKLH